MKENVLQQNQTRFHRQFVLSSLCRYGPVSVKATAAPRTPSKARVMGQGLRDGPSRRDNTLFLLFVEFYKALREICVNFIFEVIVVLER